MFGFGQKNETPNPDVSPLDGDKATENLGADPRLTDAVLRLTEAFHALADFNDGIERRSEKPAADLPPEKVMYQVLVANYENPKAMLRKGDPQESKAVAEEQAIAAIMSTYDIQHAFVARVESAYSRQISVKKVI